MSNQEGNLPSRRRWPNPDKKLGVCSIHELEKELQTKMGHGLNPNKRLRDCSEQDLEEQLVNLREQKKAKVYPNPETELKDCCVEELEEQLKNALEAKAKEPPKCYLPLITDSIFCDAIAQGFLTDEDVLKMMEVKEISALFRLQKAFCSAHGTKLTLEEPHGKPDGAIDRTTETVRLQAKINSSLPPLQPGEYDTVVPVTKSSLMFSWSRKGASLVVLRFTRFPDGRKGPCEGNGLIRNVGDSILAINGTSVADKSVTELKAMLKAGCTNKQVFLRCCEEEPNLNKFNEWMAENPSPNPASCQICCQFKEYCIGCRKQRSWLRFHSCSVCPLRRCGVGPSCRSKKKCYKCEKPICSGCLEDCRTNGCTMWHCLDDSCREECPACWRSPAFESEESDSL